MNKLIASLVIAIITLAMTSCIGSHSDSSQQEETTRIEQQRQDSIRQAKAKADSIQKEREEQARLEAEQEAKKWKGACTLSEFKAKLPGTTWGATRKRGSFYFKYEISNNTIISTAYYSSDFSEESKFGNSTVEVIDSWKSLDDKDAFAVISYEEGVDKDDWSTIPTMLVFRKCKPDAQWPTVDGSIPLVQIIK